jgi:hypothetical protein
VTVHIHAPYPLDARDPQHQNAAYSHLSAGAIGLPVDVGGARYIGVSAGGQFGHSRRVDVLSFEGSTDSVNWFGQADVAGERLQTRVGGKWILAPKTFRFIRPVVAYDAGDEVDVSVEIHARYGDETL